MHNTHAYTIMNDKNNEVFSVKTVYITVLILPNKKPVRIPLNDKIIVQTETGNDLVIIAIHIIIYAECGDAINCLARFT